MQTAALYLRSSKDRSDVSIDAQRSQLRTLAASRNVIVVAEYVDVVESGMDEFRPDFQRMLRDMSQRDRAWSAIYISDTSRIGRRRYIAQLFAQECKKASIEVVFARLPDTDPISDVILHAVFEAMDEVHSLMSRQKGMAGMTENIKQGFRAGGRAPFGYALQPVATGAVREGAAVMKSRLVLSPDAPKVADFLRGRAAGRQAKTLAREIGLTQSASSLVSIEWNALTYAGHLVWNVHNEQFREKENGKVKIRYKGGVKRRPRNEWIVTRDAHPSVIDDRVAEAVLARLEGKKAKRATYVRGETYLLSGLMFTPAGVPYHGDAGYYRPGKNRKISAANIERALVAKVIADLNTDSFVKVLTERTRALMQPAANCEQIHQAERSIERLAKQVDRLADLLADTDAPAPLLRKIEKLEAERTAAAETRNQIASKLNTARAADVNENDVRKLLGTIAENLQELNRGHLKEFMATLIERISLDIDTLTCCIHYRIVNTAGDVLASPRRSADIPCITIRRHLTLKRTLRGFKVA
jgi:site-specific DNA recombinase